MTALHPRPDFARADWVDLTGAWGFAYDDADEGRDGRWHERAERFGRTITVPFPPESPLSGIVDTGFHPIVWYRLERELADGGGRRAVLNFGAVDYKADVWVNGEHVAAHEGGHTPFRADVTGALRGGRTMTVVVRAQDDPHDHGQARGKQGWRSDPHAIWYHRTTGIWQPVWLEWVPAVHILKLHLTPDIDRGTVRVEARASRTPPAGSRFSVAFRLEGEVVAETRIAVSGKEIAATLHIPGLAEGENRSHLLWSPERPNLLDVEARLETPDGAADTVTGHAGLRSCGTAHGRFLLNGRPYFLRSVLEQGYWPQSHLAAPSGDAIRREVELIKALGFNAVRIHQKVEDLPTLVTMHEAVLSDYQSRGLLTPMGDLLKDAGVDTADFTPAAKNGVTRDGETWALPIDNNLIAWHINMNLFRQAGLVSADGTPVVPKSTEELFVQAEQFKKATGKPYLVMALANEAPGFTRLTYTLLEQQNAKFFADPKQIDLSGPEAKAAVEWEKSLVDKGLAMTGMDYAAATAAFPNGEGGVYIQGTWLLGDFVAQSEMADRPLSNGYYVVPFPQFFPGRNASWTDGHTWSMPKQDLSEEQIASVKEFATFWWDNSFAWARTGHLPASTKIVESREFLDLPQRQDFSTLPASLTGLPAGVVRQFSIQQILGEEVESAVQGLKPVDQALADAQSRVNELLANAQ